MPRPSLRRLLLRSPAPTVVVTLAISVGVLATAFGVVWAALWRPPPFHAPNGLVILHTTHRRAGGGTEIRRWSHARADALRGMATSFAGVAPYTGEAFALSGEDASASVRGEFVGPEYFTVLGVAPAAGRSFTTAESAPGGATPVVLLSHELWLRRFGGAPGVLGRSLRINGVRHEVIGIMPERFRGLTDRALLWLPAAMAPILSFPGYLTSDDEFISVVARLAPGHSLAAAQSELATVVPRLYTAIPDVDPDTADRPSAMARELNEARVPPGVRGSLTLLLAAVALLHLLATANSASLLLGRALARSGEFAIRAAIGGTPWRLFRARLLEGGGIALLGGALGTAIAATYGTLAATPLEAWGPRHFYGALAPFATPSFSLATVAVGLVIALATAVAVALPPALLVLRRDVLAGLRDGGRGGSASGTALRRPSPRTMLVGLEMTLAVVLCVVGGLMIESFARLRRTPLGVDADGVLTFSIAPSDVRVPPDAAPAYVDRMLAAIRALPGVEAASVDGGAPVSGTARATLQIVGRDDLPASDAPRVLRHYVGREHFAALGIPVVRGRAFTEADHRGAMPVAIVSAAAARAFWPGRDPIGQRVWFPGASAFTSPAQAAEVVGIVGDVRYEPLDTPANLSSVYTPYAQFTYAARRYFVRTQGDPMALAPSIRATVATIDAEVPVLDLQSLHSLIGSSWTRQQFDAWFYGAFALLALGLAMSGIHAVVSYAVQQRWREMGIRLALGARPSGVLQLVVREGMTFPAIGLTVGTALALVAGGVLRASLVGVAPSDPVVLSRTLLLLLASAVVACLIPAWRATRVDPSEAMRAE